VTDAKAVKCAVCFERDTMALDGLCSACRQQRDAAPPVEPVEAVLEAIDG
jgi:hypothetical protein